MPVFLADGAMDAWLDPVKKVARGHPTDQRDVPGEVGDQPGGVLHVRAAVVLEVPLHVLEPLLDLGRCVLCDSVWTKVLHRGDVCLSAEMPTDVSSTWLKT